MTPNQEPALLISDLVVVYKKGAPPSVDGVSLTVGRGEIVGIVGESGSGKTTVAMVAMGLQEATSGVVTVDGQAVTTRMRGARRASIQMVFQDPIGSLDPRQSIRAGFRELRRLHPSRTVWISDEDLLHQVGLSASLLDRMPNQVSGGQAQRIAIARALLLRPTLLVADEPTSALDVSVQAQILELLEQLRQEMGLSIMFISHDLAVVRGLCDTVHVMRSGRIVESGSARRVTDQPEHAYTKELIAAIPGSIRQGRLPDAAPEERHA